MDANTRSLFGEITFEDSPEVEPSFGRQCRSRFEGNRIRGRWRPSERLTQSRRFGVYLPIDRIVRPNGVKLYVVNGSLEELIQFGPTVGSEIIQEISGRSTELDFSYRRMYLVFRYARGMSFLRERGMRAHLTRSFRYSRDLYVRTSGRQGSAPSDVLPSHVGLDSYGQGTRWSITELHDRGREAAHADGHRNPTSKTAIPFGFLEAARRNPLNIAPGEVENLIRLALFDLNGLEGNPDAELVDIVTERLLIAIDRHKNEDAEAFERWLYSSGNSIVKQIAEQKRSRGGKLDRQDVKHALLHLGWQSYRYVGDSLHAFMRSVKHAIPDQLSDDEGELFAQMYERQECYGNLPFALLAERMDLLRLAVLSLWTQPDSPDQIPIIHRLLDYYRDMASSRREADRRIDARKSRNHSRQDGAATEETETARRAVGKTDAAVGATSTEFIENIHSRHEKSDEFRELANHIRELKKIRCVRGCTDWDARKSERVELEDKDTVVIDLMCSCGEQKSLTISGSEFCELGRNYFECVSDGD